LFDLPDEEEDDDDDEEEDCRGTELMKGTASLRMDWRNGTRS
jgi:hypothetical protein